MVAVMQFSTYTEEFKRGIMTCEKAISQRSALPMMENIFIQVENSRLILRGNDLEIGIEQQISDIDNWVSGSILIKSKLLMGIVTKLQGVKTEVQVDANAQVSIRSDSTVFTLNGLLANEYPVFPDLQSDTIIRLTVAQLKSIIKTTIFSVSFDETKQFLNGVCFRLEPGKLVLVSTDSYRLSVQEFGIDSATVNLSVIVPFKAVSNVAKIISGFSEADEVEIYFSDSQIGFKIRDTIIVSRLIQGDFPDYHMVMPKSFNQWFHVDRNTIINAADRASLIAAASNNVIRVNFSDKIINIRANSPSYGNFTEDISLVEWIGPDTPAKIAFNVRMLLEATRNMDGELIEIGFNSDLSPCVLKPINRSDYTHIIMPIRTSDYQ